MNIVQFPPRSPPPVPPPRRRPSTEPLADRFWHLMRLPDLEGHDPHDVGNVLLVLTDVLRAVPLRFDIYRPSARRDLLWTLELCDRAIQVLEGWRAAINKALAKAPNEPPPAS